MWQYDIDKYFVLEWTEYALMYEGQMLSYCYHSFMPYAEPSSLLSRKLGNISPTRELPQHIAEFPNMPNLAGFQYPTTSIACP
jgi:hypothetical protein